MSVVIRVTLGSIPKSFMIYPWGGLNLRNRVKIKNFHMIDLGLAPLLGQKKNFHMKIINNHICHYLRDDVVSEHHPYMFFLMQDMSYRKIGELSACKGNGIWIPNYFQIPKSSTLPDFRSGHAQMNDCLLHTDQRGWRFNERALSHNWSV